MPDHSAVPVPEGPSRRTALHAGLLAAAGLSGLAACGSGAGPAAVAAAVTPAGTPTATPHTVARLLITPGLPWAEVVSRFEKTVPPLPTAQLAAALRSESFKAVQALLAKASPVSMFLFYTLDATPFMTAAGHHAKCKTYLLGNPLIAEKMYGFNAAVMLYAPLRIAIFTDQTGTAHLVIDRPSDLFASFEEAHIATTGHSLDATLAKLLRQMEFPVPSQLST